MDFNNNGELDLEDLILTEIILEDEENEGDKKGGGSNKPSGRGYSIKRERPVEGCLLPFVFGLDVIDDLKSSILIVVALENYVIGAILCKKRKLQRIIFMS